MTFTFTTHFRCSRVLATSDMAILVFPTGVDRMAFVSLNMGNIPTPIHVETKGLPKRAGASFFTENGQPALAIITNGNH